MPLQFKEVLNIPPLPVDEARAGMLGRMYATEIATAGGRQQAARAAAAAVMLRTSNEPASEAGRLQRLFAQVYTRAELEQLMLNTFDALGLRD